MNDRQFQFEWDELKAIANVRKHGVSFELAATVFTDPRLLTLADLGHGENEERWYSTGLASNAAMLSLVLHYSPDPARALTEAARALRPDGRILVVDMQPHERVEYQQQMGHVWLGFSEKQIDKLLTGAGFGDVRLRPLPVDPDARGPALFAAVARRL